LLSSLHRRAETLRRRSKSWAVQRRYLGTASAATQAAREIIQLRVRHCCTGLRITWCASKRDDTQLFDRVAVVIDQYRAEHL
jgi:hypothetical protein